LVTELPPEIDQALVANGYKARLGVPALNTLVHRVAVLSKAHQLARESNPCGDALVRELLGRTRRAYAQRGARPHKQRALTKDPLQAVLATCDETLRGKRDRALLLFAWATGGRRRSEVAAATTENLRRVDANSYVYTLTHSKTNQSGQDRPEDVKPLVGSAALAMKVWLAASAIKEGALFRRIRKGGHVGARGCGGEVFCALSEGGLRDRGRQTEYVAARDDGDDRTPQRGDRDGLFPI
jgi:integrase